MSDQSYHIHVYRVVELVEINLNASSGKEARKKALEMVTISKYKKSKLDCHRIALSFKFQEMENNEILKAVTS